MTTKTDTKTIISSWQLWGAVLALAFGGIGFAATSMLLRLPGDPNCRHLFIPLTSASNRLYCAQVKAEKGNVDGLLEAIALVRGLVGNHPLSAELERYIDQWSEQILAFAEEEFQAGKLDAAIKIARKIPSVTGDYHRTVTARIDEWRSIWQEGEGIQREIERQLNLSNWNQAFIVAIKLLNVDNDYWQTTKYQEIVQNINLAKEESKKLDGAYAALRRKGIDNILKAIEIASTVDPSSYAYQEAKKLIESAREDLLEYAQNLIDTERWDELSTFAAEIPPQVNLQAQADDWTALASAGIKANLGTVSGLDLAIAQLEAIDTDSEVYQLSQQFIQNWQLKKADLAHLASARELAEVGSISHLNQAIAKAQLIGSDNPMHREAQRDIESWQREIQIIEDRPLLERSRQIAMGNNIVSWREAISQANLIAPNRALYSEAQSLVRQWSRNIQTQEDRPFLNQAIALASRGNYQEAINAASQIRSGRVLYRDAQARVRGWRQEIKAQQDIQKAYQIAKANTPQALYKAINIARGIPSATAVSGESRLAIDRWAQQLLAIANNTMDSYSKSSIQEAINIAEMIPYGSSAYSQAREQVKTWENQLKPPLIIPPPEPTIQETNFSQESDI